MVLDPSVLGEPKARGFCCLAWLVAYICLVTQNWWFGLVVWIGGSCRRMKNPSFTAKLSSNPPSNEGS